MSSAHADARRLEPTRKANVVLWVAQGVLAAIFLFTGGMKLVLPISQMTRQIAFPGLFLRFIGVAEVLGAAGLVLPGLVGVWTFLTPLAAAGLVIIMIGATALTVAHAGVGPAFTPLAVGLLALLVAYGRWRLVPLRRSPRGPVAQGVG